MSNCNGCNKNIFSNTACPCDCKTCNDACVNPSCGDPKHLTVLSPVVYDEIGVNICRNIDVSKYACEYPSLAYLDFQPLTYSFACKDNPSIVQITNRPNCYEVTLSKLEISFIVKIYDCCKKLIGTEVAECIVYLPEKCDPNYNAKTNPCSVSFEVFAPYGISYVDNTTTPALNAIGFSTTNNMIAQGLNLTVIPKVLNYDAATQSVNVGLSLIVSSVYFAPYLICHNGKACVSKGSSAGESASVCKKFVEGGLLDRNIKPLEFDNPCDVKEDCNDGNLDPCDDITACDMDDIFE